MTEAMCAPTSRPRCRAGRNFHTAGTGGYVVDDQQTVEVRLEDLCTIADAIGTMMGDLYNGKWKHLDVGVDRIHEVTEKWANDKAVLGGGCHDDHRCGPCRSVPILFHPVFVGSGMPAESTRMSTDMLKSRLFDSEDDDAFLLLPISEFVAKVMYRDQVGYFGVVGGWDVSEPYTYTRYREQVSPDCGIEGFTLARYLTPDAALIELCRSMMEDEHGRGSAHLTCEEMRDAAGDVLVRLVEELTG